MKCPKCGASNPNGKRFCGECGSPIGEDEKAPKSSDWSGNEIALVVGSLLALIGVFLPWITLTLNFPYIEKTITGLSGDGILLLIGAIIILSVGLAKRGAWKVTLLLGGLMFLLALYYTLKLSGAGGYEDGVTVSIGPGAGLCTLGFLIVVVGSINFMIKAGKNTSA